MIRVGLKVDVVLPEQVAQKSVKPGLERFPGMGSFPGQLVPVPHHPHSREFLSNIQARFPVFHKIKEDTVCQ